MSIREKSYYGINHCLRCGNKMQFHQDREGKLRKKCESCDWIYYKNPVPAVACVIINEDKELVVVKRLFEPCPGKWALPSGYIEIDQSPEEAAVSEMEEETGLIGRVKRFLGYYDGYSPIYEKVLSLGYLMEIVGGELKAGDDAEEAEFVKLTELPAIAFGAHKYFIKQIENELK
ncbi:MAG: NUDIX domain-containing protein [Candidatus Cloacimonadia bacterium]